MDKNQTPKQAASAELTSLETPVPSMSLKVDNIDILAVVERNFNELVDLYHLPEGAAEDHLFEDDATDSESEEENPLSKRRMLIEQIIGEINGIQAEEDQKTGGFQLIQVFFFKVGFRPTDKQLNMLQKLAEDSPEFKAHLLKHQHYLFTAFAQQDLRKGFEILSALGIPLSAKSAEAVGKIVINTERLDLLLWLSSQKLFCVKDFPSLFIHGLETASAKENWEMLRFLLRENPAVNHHHCMLLMEEGKVEGVKIFLESLKAQGKTILDFRNPEGIGLMDWLMYSYLGNTKLASSKVVWLEILDLFVESLPGASSVSSAGAAADEKTLLDLGLDLTVTAFSTDELNFITKNILKRYPHVKLVDERPGTLNLLQRCAESPRLIRTVKWLIDEHNYDPEVRTESGNTVVLLAAESGNVPLVKAFAEKEITRPKTTKSSPKKGKKGKAKSEASKKEIDMKVVNHQGRHIGYYLLSSPAQIDLLLSLIKSNQIDLLHCETTSGWTLLDRALSQGEPCYPVVHACFSQISTYKKETQQAARDLFKNKLFLKQFLAFFQGHRADKTLAWIFEEMPLEHLIFSTVTPEEISVYLEKLGLNLTLCNREGETVMPYLKRLGQTEKALAVLNSLLDAGQIELLLEADICLMLDFALSQTEEMKAFQVLWLKLPSALCTTYIKQLEGKQLSILLDIYPEIAVQILMAIATEIFDEAEQKIAATERVAVGELLQDMTHRVQAAHDAEQSMLIKGMPLPLCYDTPDEKYVLRLIQSLLNSPRFKDLNLYIFGSTLYKPTYDDIDILIPDVVDAGKRALVTELMHAIKAIQYCGRIFLDEKAHGTLGYKHEKLGVVRHVIPVTINDIKIEFICVNQDYNAYAAGLDFTLGVNFFDVRAHAYAPTALGKARSDFQAGIIDTVIDPIESFRLDPSRVLRALRIVASCDALKLSQRCHEAIQTMFAGYEKAPTYSREFSMNIDRLHTHLKKMYKHGHDKKNVQLLLKYHVFNWIVGMLSCSTHGLSYDHLGTLKQRKASLHPTLPFFKPETAQAASPALPEQSVGSAAAAAGPN